MSFQSKILIGSLLLLGLCSTALAVSTAESSAELTCRAKAKVTAAEVYRGCVTEYKSAEIERLRRDYQQRLKTLKDEYEEQIDHLGAKTKSAKAKANAKNKSSVADSSPQDGLVSVKSSPAAPEMEDQSRMDLPEPIPVENSPSSL